MSVQREVLDAARRDGAVVAFDLDSTLLDNRPRSVRIFREFAEAHEVPELRATAPEHFQDWDLVHVMANAGVAEERARALKDALIAFWRPRFFSGEYCIEDRAIAGAAPFVRAVAEAGARVAYATGRHEGMRDGTLESFRRNGFPSPGPRVHLVMKPAFEMHDDHWKAMAHGRLRGLGEVVAAFDNEPTHINGYAESFPGAILVHIATDHSGRPVALHPSVRSISGFEGF